MFPPGQAFHYIRVEKNAEELRKGEIKMIDDDEIRGLLDEILQQCTSEDKDFLIGVLSGILQQLKRKYWSAHYWKRNIL